MFYKFAPLLTVVTISLNMSLMDALLHGKSSSSTLHTFSKILPKRFLSMDAVSGAQEKREQVIVKKDVSSSSNLFFTPKTVFHNPPAQGAGTDERFSFAPPDERLEQDSSLITNVHLSYMKMGLLTDLSSDKFGLLDKYEKVKLKTKEQVLSSADYQWSPTLAHAGGLLNDWTFNME